MRKSIFRTYTGKNLDILNLTENEIDIKDIAKALSQICRYAGHIRNFYSVAQHCCHVLELVEDNHLGALLHDASEAYVSDVPSPIKKRCPDLMEIENGIQDVISVKYRCQLNTKEIKEADRKILATEFRDLLHCDPAEYDLLEPIKNVKIKTWEPWYAEKRFLLWYEEYKLEDAYARAFARMPPAGW